jgi:hypothetical protein
MTMGAVQYANEAAETLANATPPDEASVPSATEIAPERKEALEKLGAFGQTMSTTLNTTFGNDMERMFALVSYTAGFAKGVGYDKDKLVEFVAEIFEASSLIPTPAEPVTAPASTEPST